MENKHTIIFSLQKKRCKIFLPKIESPGGNFGRSPSVYNVRKKTRVKRNIAQKSEYN